MAGAKVRVVEAEPTTRLESGEEYVWPWVQGRNGEAIDLSRIPGPETRSPYGKPFSAEVIRKAAGAAEEINHGNAGDRKSRIRHEFSALDSERSRVAKA